MWYREKFARQKCPNLTFPILEQLTAMFHEVNPYVQSFVSLTNCTTPFHAPNTSQVVIYEDMTAAHEHERCYKGPKTS